MDEHAFVGACRSCRYLVTNEEEIAQELRLLNNDGKTVLHTAERTGGEGVRNVDLHISVEQALRRATGLTPDRIGLCEAGVATFVDRQAGLTPDDKCSKWKERGAFHQLRPNWRQFRGLPHDKCNAATEPRLIQELLPVDPCPCRSGRTFGVCCAVRLGIFKGLTKSVKLSPVTRCIFCVRVIEGDLALGQAEYDGKPVCADCTRAASLAAIAQIAGGVGES